MADYTFGGFMWLAGFITGTAGGVAVTVGFCA